MEEHHEEMLTESKSKVRLSASQVYFNHNNKYLTFKTHGKCIICNGNTSWNERTTKYNRLCSNPKCAETYRENFKKRMMKKYNKVHLLNDPEKQKEMLANRKISGTYNFKGKEITYTGTLELAFLRFLDEDLEWNKDDILMPAPHIFRYKYKNSEKFHIPDAYIPSLNLIINIKSSQNKHYRLRDIDQEKAIDNVILSDGQVKYIKLFDGVHTEFIMFLNNLSR